MNQLENFIRAFGSGVSSITRICQCGVPFYIGDAAECWNEGEYESLQADPKSRALGFMVPSIILDGACYVSECTCWHTKAEKIMAWLDHNDRSIAEWFRLEKERKTEEAADAVEIELYQP